MDLLNLEQMEEIEEVIVIEQVYKGVNYLVDPSTNEIVSEEGEIEGLFINKIPLLTPDIKNLDIKQMNVLDKFKLGENIFVSGPAGTGKSHLIKILKMYSILLSKKMQVTAMTGCASQLLKMDSKTIHSWAGIGIYNNTFESIYISMCKRGRKKIWGEIDILVCDEVSMMSKKLFELLDYIGKRVRRNNKPFGGIQLIFSGDFYQLPPICGENSDPEDGKFCFESLLWKDTFPETTNLTKIYRQDDRKFTTILNQIRIGEPSRAAINILRKRMIPCKLKDIKPTMVLPRRNVVDRINQREHSKLPIEKSKKYKPTILEESDKLTTPLEKILEKKDISEKQYQKELKYHKKLWASLNSIEIRVGDQVMCTHNINEQLVNGTRGVVIDIQENPIVKLVDGTVTEIVPYVWTHERIPGLSFKLMPLMYAWALTIHKCQGTTLDLCIIDVGSGIFEYGQTYVALSRVKSLNGLYITSLNPSKIKVNPKVKAFY